MTVNVGRCVAFQRRPWMIARKGSRRFIQISAAFIVASAALFGPTSTVHAASVGLTAVATITGGSNVSCQGTVCSVFDSNHAVGGESVTLDGSNSTPSVLTGNPITNYIWTTADGSINLNTPNARTPDVTLKDGVRDLQLTVTDSEGFTNSTTITLQ